MKLVTSAEMRNLELELARDYAIPTVLMMESAAKSVADECLSMLREHKIQPALIICGTGNNGGDGLAVARALFFENVPVKVVLVGDELKLKGDAKINMDITSRLGIPMLVLKSEEELPSLERLIGVSDIMIDALFGTGLDREVTGLYKAVIELINRAKKRVLSIDAPSGINSDTGEVMGAAVKANRTVTLGLPKIGLYHYPGCVFAGDIVIKNNFVPQRLIDRQNFKAEIFLDEEIPELLPKRWERSNKGSFGRVYMVAGCGNMPGAAVLASKAALKSGCGLVRACVTQNVANVIHMSVPEAVTLILPERNGALALESLPPLLAELESASCVLVGPGLSATDATAEFLEGLLPEISSPLMLDADALNILAKDLSMLRLINAPFVITPHPAEMSRLSGVKIPDILKNPTDCAREFSKTHNCVTVLKDAKTVVSTPNGDIYINTSGNNSLAKAGSGDALAGIIAGFIAQGLAPFAACKLGTFIHGRAGESASREKSNYGVLCTDLIDEIPKVMLNYSEFS